MIVEDKTDSGAINFCNVSRGVVFKLLGKQDQYFIKVSSLATEFNAVDIVSGGVYHLSESEPCRIAVGKFVVDYWG